jgi:hypothetical protein
MEPDAAGVSEQREFVLQALVELKFWHVLAQDPVWAFQAQPSVEA